tara:strand:+ start:53 stop:358 length:306 start_codon:yes stop_codon:yes gene_type:complete
MIEVKKGVFISYNSGFIVTKCEKLIEDKKSERFGETVLSSALTYKRAKHAVDGIKRYYGVDVTIDDITQAYEQSKREYAIKAAKSLASAKKANADKKAKGE